MRRWALVLAIALAAAACSDTGSTGTSTTTTTTTGTACESNVALPIEGHPTDACRAIYLGAVARQQKLDLTEHAEAQAKALCREIGTSGLVTAMANAFLGWKDGSRPEPSTDHEGFVAVAVAIYCPEHFQALQGLN